VLQLAEDVRVYILNEAAKTGDVPQAEQIAATMNRPLQMIRSAIRDLAASRALVLAPNDEQIWAAEPFCATPTDFRIVANRNDYWALCIWDALGVPAALSADATVYTSCGDCGQAMQVEVRNGVLTQEHGVVHFGVPARRFWDNIAFT
jgi:hypothetical protein